MPSRVVLVTLGSQCSLYTSIKCKLIFCVCTFWIYLAGYCQTYCWPVLNPDKLKPFNYLNLGLQKSRVVIYTCVYETCGGRNNTGLFDG